MRANLASATARALRGSYFIDAPSFVASCFVHTFVDAATLTTSYRIDGCALQTYAGPFTVPGSGAHSVAFFSSDPAGNVETSHSVSFTIQV